MNNYVGQKIGCIYIIEQLENKVKCYCSNCQKSRIEFSVDYIENLKNTKTITTCGCKYIYGKNKEQQLKLGKKYCQLTIVKKIDTEMYLCECTCETLEKVSKSDLINNKIQKCANCKEEENKRRDYIKSNRYGKELYYIWTSYLDLYKNPTPKFKKNIIDRGIKFFPILEGKENGFKLFWQWANTNNYGIKEGRTYMKRKDLEKDFDNENCVWADTSEDKDGFVTLSKYNIERENREVEDKEIEIPSKKGTLIERPVEDVKKELEDRKYLINFLYSKYNVKSLIKRNSTLIKNLNNGNSLAFDNVIITYEEIRDMLEYYEEELESIYKSKCKKNKEPKDGNMRMLYDISVIARRYDNYIDRPEVRYNQSNSGKNPTDKYMIDIRQYIQPNRKKKSENTSCNNNFAKEFADWFTRDLDDDYEEDE